MNKNRFLAGLLCALAVSMSACGNAEEQATVAVYEVASLSATTVKVANPKAAVAAIYDDLKEYKAEELDADAVEAVVGIDNGDITDFYAYYSDAKAGLSDIIIVKPISYSRDEVRECLYKYKEQRVREFENYNILNSYTIAQDAVIYDQGDYIILLMMEDNESAKITIDEYIPQ